MAESQITRAVLLSVRQMEIELNVVATESGSQAEKITYCFSESVITGRDNGTRSKIRISQGEVLRSIGTICFPHFHSSILNDRARDLNGYYDNSSDLGRFRLETGLRLFGSLL